MNYIERNPEKCFSMPSLVGRRLTVFDIVTLTDGGGLEFLIKDYNVSREQAKAAIEYCHQLSCKINGDEFQYCDGCILRTVADGDNFNKDDYCEITNQDNTISTFSKDGKIIFAGSIEEFEREERGIET